MTPKQLSTLRASDVSEHGNRIVAALRLVGKTQMDLSRGTGLTPQYVSDLVKGRYLDPRISTACKLAEFFGCAIEDLFPCVETVTR